MRPKLASRPNSATAATAAVAKWHHCEDRWPNTAINLFGQRHSLYLYLADIRRREKMEVARPKERERDTSPIEPTLFRSFPQGGRGQHAAAERAAIIALRAQRSWPYFGSLRL